MNLPQIKYQFPKNGRNPFDPENEHKFFILADEFSLTSDNLNDFNVEVLDNFVPMGYKSIIICQRIGLFSCGSLVANWEHILEDKAIFYIISDRKISLFVKSWGRSANIYLIPKGNFEDLSFQSIKWDNLNLAFETAKSFSQQKQSKVLVVKVMDCISWH